MVITDARSSTEADPEAGEAVAGMRTLLQAGDFYRSRVAEHFGLGWTEIQAIGHLLSAGEEELGQTELAGRLRITTAAATALVDRLERSEVAARHPHPQDRRRSLIRLTDRGMEVVELSRRWTVHAFDGIDPDQRSTLAEHFHIVADNLRRQADQF